MQILRHLGAGGGQGLTEVVAVLGVFGGLVAVAVPGYLGMQDRKADKAAQTHLRAAVWTAEAYRASHGSYAGMDALDLLRIDPRTPPALTVASARRGRYCLTDNVRGRTWSIAGPSRGAHKLTANATCTP
jgi:type II secretory pathway pseudopilin PulG